MADQNTKTAKPTVTPTPAFAKAAAAANKLSKGKRNKAFDIMMLDPEDINYDKEVVVFQRNPENGRILDWEFTKITGLHRYIHAKYKGQEKTFRRDTGISTGEDNNFRMVSLSDPVARRIVDGRQKSKDKFAIKKDAKAAPLPPTAAVKREIGDSGPSPSRSREETVLAGAMIVLEQGPLSVIRLIGEKLCMRIAVEFAARELGLTKKVKHDDDDPFDDEVRKS